jgi:hypothetical protein
MHLDSYNKSLRDVLFIKFISIKNYTCFRHLLSIIRSLNTVYTGVFVMLVMLTER